MQLWSYPRLLADLTKIEATSISTIVQYLDVMSCGLDLGPEQASQAREGVTDNKSHFLPKTGF